MDKFHLDLNSKNYKISVFYLTLDLLIHLFQVLIVPQEPVKDIINIEKLIHSNLLKMLEKFHTLQEVSQV